MAFGKKSADKSPPPARGGSPRPGAEGSLSIIGPGMSIVGDVVTEGSVRIEGRVEGTIRASKQVTVGKDGEVVGDIVTQDAVIGGLVRGTVVAESRLELQATCDIEGQVRTPSQHLHLEEGARFNGQIQMSGSDAPLALPSSTVGENSPVAGEFSTP